MNQMSINQQFHWTENSYLKHLIKLIEDKKVTVTPCTHFNDEDDYAFEIIKYNFVELKDTYIVYKNTTVTDMHGGITYKISGSDFFYYVVGKLNPATNEEDLYIFFNEGTEFNIMKCKQVCAGSAAEGLYNTLLSACIEAKVYKEEKSDPRELNI